MDIYHVIMYQWLIWMMSFRCNVEGCSHFISSPSFTNHPWYWPLGQPGPFKDLHRMVAEIRQLSQQSSVGRIAWKFFRKAHCICLIILMLDRYMSTGSWVKGLSQWYISYIHCQVPAIHDGESSIKIRCASGSCKASPGRLLWCPRQVWMHFKIQKTAESRNIPEGSRFMKGIPFIFEIRMDQRTLVGVSESYVQGYLGTFLCIHCLTRGTWSRRMAGQQSDREQASTV